jgi:hypothetical protein
VLRYAGNHVLRRAWGTDVCWRMFSVLTAALLALLCVLGVLWIKRREARNEVMPDARISTLVFPPESKFHSSVSSRH